MLISRHQLIDDSEGRDVFESEINNSSDILQNTDTEVNPRFHCCSSLQLVVYHMCHGRSVIVISSKLISCISL
jgi:hypothetical protein